MENIIVAVEAKIVRRPWVFVACSLGVGLVGGLILSGLV